SDSPSPPAPRTRASSLPSLGKSLGRHATRRDRHCRERLAEGRDAVAVAGHDVELIAVEEEALLRFERDKREVVGTIPLGFAPQRNRPGAAFHEPRRFEEAVSLGAQDLERQQDAGGIARIAPALEDDEGALAFEQSAPAFEHAAFVALDVDLDDRRRWRV